MICLGAKKKLYTVRLIPVYIYIRKVTARNRPHGRQLAMALIRTYIRRMNTRLARFT